MEILPEQIIKEQSQQKLKVLTCVALQLLCSGFWMLLMVSPISADIASQTTRHLLVLSTEKPSW